MLLIAIPLFCESQTHEYLFNSNLNELNGGPALIQKLGCGATAGAYSTVTAGTTSGECLTSSAYCFNDGGGLQYPNPGLITGTYTINMFFRFSSLGGGYARVIDFSNSASDAGLYFLGNCLNFYPNGNVGPCPYFNTNTYYLMTFVRDGSTGIISVYVDGTVFGSYNDSGNLYSCATATTPINFFFDDMVVTCENEPGCIKYISVSPTVTSAADVALLFANIATLTQSVNAPPVVTIAPADSITCSNNTVTLTASSSAGSIVWNGGLLINAPNPSTVNAPNMYIATVTDVNACIGKDTIVVTMDTVPPVVTAISSGNFTCSVTSVTLTGSSSGNTMVWNGGALVNATNPATVNSAGTYTVTATDALNGCTNTATVIVTSDTVQSLVIAVNSATICTGQSAILTATGATTFSWSTGAVNNSITISPTTTTSYTVTGVTGGCSDSAVATVTVGLSVTVNSPSVCGGQTATLTASGGTSYLWSTGETTSSISVNGVAATYFVIGSNGSCSDTAISVVTVVPQPTVSFTADTLNGCQSFPVNFSADTTGNPGATYSWNFGEGATGSGVNPSHTFTTVGCHTIIMTVDLGAGCIATDSIPCMITVFPTPNAGFNISPEEIEILAPTAYFTNTSTNTTGFTNWLWNFGDATNSTINNPNHTYTDVGSYPVQLIAINPPGCADTAMFLVVVKDIVTLYVPNAFTPDKNDCNDYFNIHSYGISPENYELLIFDRWGILIFKTNNLYEGWNGAVNNIGEVVKMDTYVYHINYKDSAGKKNSLIGRISLIK